MDKLVINYENFTPSTMPNDSLMLLHNATELLAYKVGMAIHYYYTPVISVFGLIGNILALMVMLLPHNRKLSCCVYLAGLAICDNIALIAAFFLWYLTAVVEGNDRSDIECKVIALFFQSGATGSTFIIVAVTLDRFLATCFPIKSMGLRTWRKALIALAIVLVMAFIFNIPFMLMAKFVDEHTTLCTGFSKRNDVATEFYAIANIFFFSLLPFFLILAMNIAIVRKIRKMEQKKANRQSNYLSTVSSGQETPQGNSSTVFFCIGEDESYVSSDQNMLNFSSFAMKETPQMSRLQEGEKEEERSSQQLNTTNRSNDLIETRDLVSITKDGDKHGNHPDAHYEQPTIQKVPVHGNQHDVHITNRIESPEAINAHTIPNMSSNGKNHRPTIPNPTLSVTNRRAQSNSVLSATNSSSNTSLQGNSSRGCKIRTGLLSRLRSRSNSDSRRLDKQLSKLLLVVSFTFLVLTLPQYIRYTAYVFINHQSDYVTFANYVLFYNLSQKLFMTNDAINFLLYCIGGTRFRGDLRKIFSCRWQKKHNRT